VQSSIAAHDSSELLAWSPDGDTVDSHALLVLDSCMVSLFLVQRSFIQS
jgi:hypothetical protein